MPFCMLITLLQAQNFIAIYSGVNRPKLGQLLLCLLLKTDLDLVFGRRKEVQPEAAVTLGNSSELGILVADTQAVHKLYDDWKKKGIRIIQEPIRMDFGLNFVAVDPDGHRLRIFEHS